MRPNTKRERGTGTDHPTATVLRLPRGRATEVLQDMHERLAEAAKEPEDLSKDDLIELYNILELAIGAHYAGYKATAPMLDSFVEEIYRGWHSEPHFVQPVERPAKFPYRLDEDSVLAQYTSYEFVYGETRPEPEEPIIKKHPRLKSAYCSIEVSFKNKSFTFFLTGRNESGGRDHVELDEFELSQACRTALAVDIIEFMGGQCDEHNESRAVKYARFYIQQKALSRGSGSVVSQYKFEQFSDIFDQMPDLERFCDWVRKPAPRLFGVIAEKV